MTEALFEQACLLAVGSTEVGSTCVPPGDLEAARVQSPVHAADHGGHFKYDLRRFGRTGRHALTIDLEQDHEREARGKIFANRAGTA